MDIEIIGIDHGNAAIKTRNASFPNGITEYDFEPYTKQNVLEYGGKYYVCGSGRLPLLKDKTTNDSFYLLTLTAIAKELDHRKCESRTDVILAAGLPLTGFGLHKEKFKQYLLRGKAERFVFESRDYEITIRDVMLYPQGYTAILSNMHLIENEPSVIVCDIGGWTVDIMRLDNAIPNAETCRSLELGMIRCFDEIGEQVRRNTGKSLTSAQIETVLKGEACSIDSKARQMTLEYGRRYAGKLLSAISESGFDAGAMPIIFLGGGAGLMKRHVTPQDGLCRAIVLEDVCANAAGYERLARQMSQKLSP
ncbi:ParM/StbA family protein [Christensenella minuta]|uniref:ParM/StbA family protein n=1 Tax=Christensenella minuta TaxID=626937 RepID=UPI0021583B8C|nr:ParM/StbA family protein [Christensenella minuta]